MTQAAAPFDAFREKWLHAEPEARLLQVFAPESRAAAAEAVLVLAHELESTILASTDPRVTAAKLGWWVEELSGVARGSAQHPISRRLLDSGTGFGGANSIVPMVSGAAALAEVESVARIDDWLGGAENLALPVETMLAMVTTGASAPDSHLRKYLGAALLARSLRHFPQWATDARGWIPLDLLARHGLSRAALAADPRSAAAAAVLADLAGHIAVRLDARPPPGLARVSRLRLDLARQLAQRAARFPARLLAGDLRLAPVRSVVALWRVARRP